MSIFKFIKNLFVTTAPVLPQWQPQWSQYLNGHVSFYRTLNQQDKLIFEQRANLFLHTTNVEAGDQVDVTQDDRLLVAASAIIPVWGFPNWHYFNLKSVFLLR
ncbi:hypothetical protein TYM08_P0429 [Marinicellulosiphila megalodicopiae]